MLDATETINAHRRRVNCLEFVKDGYLATGSSDQTIKIWNTGEVRTIAVLKGSKQPVNSLLCLSPLTMISGSDGVYAWDIETQKPIFVYEEHTAAINSLCMYEFSTFISASSDTSMKIWDLRTKRSTQTLQSHKLPINSVTQANENSILSGGDDGLVKRWDIRT